MDQLIHHILKLAVESQPDRAISLWSVILHIYAQLVAFTHTVLQQDYYGILGATGRIKADRTAIISIGYL